MGKKNKFLIKLLSGFLVTSLLMGSLPINKVYAQEGASANELTSSMITFFRESRTGLNVDAVSRDEVITYGIFISNFFVPGVTTVGDIGAKIKEAKEGEETQGVNTKELAKTISSKFFGSEGNQAEVQKINNKVYTALSDGFDNNLFDLTYNGKVISGKDFLQIIGAVDGTKVINNNSSSKEFLNLESDSVKASIKVAYAINPNFFLGEKGLLTANQLYGDGFGNIWASMTEKSSDGVIRPGDIDSYVLVLPACLNPVVFSDASKFPVVNSFVMGNLLDVTKNFFTPNDSTAKIEPYYNIEKYLRSGNKNINSMLSIYGISSVYDIGHSDDFFMPQDQLDKNKVERHTKVPDFLKSDASIKGYVNGIMIALKPETDNGIYSWKDCNNSVQKIFQDATMQRNLFKYLNDSMFIPLSKLSDRMVYFNTGISDPNSTNDWSALNSPTIVQSLFTCDVNEPSAKKVTRETLYDGAYTLSPLGDILLGTNTDYKDDVDLEFIKKFFNLNLSEYINKQGDLPGADLADVRNLINKNTLLAGVTAVPYYSKYLSNASFLQSFWSSKKYTFGYGVTENDSTLSILNTKKEAWGGVKATLTSNNTFDLSTDTGLVRFTYDVSTAYVGYKADNLSLLNNAMQNFYTYKIFGIVPVLSKALTGDKAGIQKEGYTLASNIANDVNHWPGIYWGYLSDLLGIEYDEKAEKWKNSNFYNTHLPEMTIKTVGGTLDLNAVLSEGSTGLASDDNKTQEEMQKDIIKKIYGLLSPEDNEYRTSLVKATLDSLIISLHRAITGSWVGNVLSVSTGVSNSYSPVVGYINTPNLTDFTVTNWLMNNYMNIYTLILLFVIVVLIMLAFTGLRTIRQSIVTFLVMAVVLMLPNTLLNNAISFSNGVTDSMFSGRFNYWTITQHQQSVQALETKKEVNLMDIINQNISSSVNVYSTDAGVRVKWLAPKRSGTFLAFFNDSMSNSSMATNMTVFNWLFSSYFNQEEYVYSNTLATYMYRPYNDIAQTARDYFDESQSLTLTEYEVGEELREYQNDTLKGEDYSFVLMGREINSTDLEVQYSDDQAELIEAVKPKNLGGNTNYRLWGISNNIVSDSIFRDEYELRNAGITTVAMLNSVSGKEFSILTESPYYHFYNTFKTRYKSSNKSFKSSLLDADTFVVKDMPTSKVNNKMRDFLDFEGLFTYIIPYLNESNNYVGNWIRLNGDDVPRYDFDKGSSTNSNSGFGDAQKKKEALEQVWNLYAPWVDMLYDTNIYNKKVMVARKRVTVVDTLNPGAYDQVGRSMVWSEADMLAKNYSTHELSEVERKLQLVEQKTYEDLMYLLNYYDFDDEVLLSMGAMMATFNFNEVFSETNILSESINLYPQGFEMKNFNYDAFMRMTLMNATGEPLMDKKDLYTRIMEKTSVITGLLLLTEDVIATIIVPAIKLVTILLLTLLGLLICVSCILNPPEKVISTVSKVLVLPIILFTVCNIIFAYVVSIFLGEGLVSYVGSKSPTLATNDPSMTIFMLILVGGVYIYIMLKILKHVFESFKSHGLSVLFTTLGLVAGVTTTIGAYAKNKVKMGYSGVRADRRSIQQGKRIAEGINAGVSQGSERGLTPVNLGNTNKSTASEGENLTQDIEKLATTPKVSVNSPVVNTEATTQSEAPTTSKQVVQRKRIGQKYVDVKYGMLSAGDMLSDVKDKGLQAVDYVASGNMTQDVKTGVGKTVTAVKDTGSKAMHTVKDTGSKAVNYVASGELVDDAKTVIGKTGEYIKDGAIDTTIKVYDKALDPRLRSISNAINDTRDYEKVVQQARVEKLKTKLGDDTSKMSESQRIRYNKEMTRSKTVQNKKQSDLTFKAIKNLKENRNSSRSSAVSPSLA